LWCNKAIERNILEIQQGTVGLKSGAVISAQKQK
jgi:hypothetical protein